jgi:hypothetical protein
MSDDDDFARTMYVTLQQDEYGGEWKKNLPPDDPDYDPNAEFDQSAEDLKHEGRSAFAGLFAHGTKDRLNWEWAEFCQECAFLDTPLLLGGKGSTFYKEDYTCKKLGVKLELEWLRLHKKREDCPLGFDHKAFIAKRESELNKKEARRACKEVRDLLLKLYHEQGEEVFNTLLKSVRGAIKRSKIKEKAKKTCNIE